MANDDAAVWDLLAAAVREMEERVDEEFGVGAFQDLGRSWLAVFLRRPETLEADKACLAGRLVRCGVWRIHEPDAKQRLLERAQANHRIPQEVQVELARYGFERASEGLGVPQTIRFGKSPWLPVERREEWSADEKDLLIPRAIRRLRSRPVILGRGKWVKDEEGHQVTVTPDSLSPGLKLIWYAAAAKRAAEDLLEGDAREEVWEGAEPLVEEIPPEGAITPPIALDALVAAEEAEEARDRVADLLNVASPRQEQILAGLQERLAAGLTEDEARAAVAEDLGISRSTLRVQLRLLRQKAI